MNRRKILWLVIACLIVLSLILASCGKSATTPTTPTTTTTTKSTTTSTTTTTTKSTTTPPTVTFEQKRSAVVTYLRAFNNIENDFDSAFSQVVPPSSMNSAADFVAWTAAVNKWVTAIDGAISRLAELKPSALEPSTSTHLQQARSYYQSIRTILKALLDAVAAGNAAGILQKVNELSATDAVGSALNRTTEQLMLRYNITDSEVNYRFRGK
jgi:hypothetical protein